MPRFTFLLLLLIAVGTSWVVNAQTDDGSDDTPEPTQPLPGIVKVIESGFKLIGTTYKTAEADIQDCYVSGCEMDYIYGQKCKGWNYLNGTCYYLHTYSDVIANPKFSAVRVSFAKLGPDTGYIFNDVLFVGNDMKQTTASRIQDCLPICQGMEGCRAYSWHNNTCWFKSKRGLTVAKKGIQSAMAYPSGAYLPAVFVLQQGVEYVGNDVVHTSSPSVDDCSNQCLQASSQCKVFSWSKALGGTCYFKSGKNETRINLKMTSGVPVFGVAP